MKTLRVATCQYCVEPTISHNLKFTLRQMREASDRGADIAHFSEAALTGYAGVDIPHTSVIDGDELLAATQEIQTLAGKLRLWVLLGSTHRLSGKHKPHNSLYVIDNKGRVVGRYDKRFCTGTDGKHPTHDLAHYSPGDHFTTFKLKGFTCGLLICYDYRFPELYREYKKLGVSVIFQSFHNARKTTVADQKYNIWKTIVPATMSCRAAENHFWISANNSATRPSCWGSFTVRPDGQIMGKLPVHRAGVLITEMTNDPKIYDAPAAWRARVMQGTLFSGRPVKDPRSQDVTCL